MNGALVLGAPLEGPPPGGGGGAARARRARREEARRPPVSRRASPASTDIEVAFLSASEIARELGAGNDPSRHHRRGSGARDASPTRTDKIALLAPLGFGRADVVVAVPELWIDVWTMEDLDDVAAGFRARHGRRLRIATKYWNLTQRFFASHGIALYRVVESLGATEGAPAAGTADLIVDITTTGSTLAANHLKVLEDGVILRSEAHLALSRSAVPDADAERRRQPSCSRC